MRNTFRRLVRPTREERAERRGRDAWIVVTGAYVLLGFAYLAPQTSAGVPVEWASFMIRVLQFHLGLLVAAIAIYTLVRRNWKAGLVALPLVAITLGPAGWTYVDRGVEREASGAPTRLMTANLLVSNDEHTAMAAEIKRAKPDVLVLQEYSDAWHEALQDTLGDQLPHSAHETREDSFGTALYSRTEIPKDQQSSPALGSGDTPQTRAVVTIGGEDVAIYNIHLLPPIGLDYVREGHRQFEDLVRLVEEDKLPVIVVGDLNLTETTPQHERLEDIGLRDAWDLAGRGRGTTWPNKSFLRYLPGLRLDHVYVSKEIAVLNVRIGEGRGSDHRPVIADLAMRE